MGLLSLSVVRSHLSALSKLGTAAFSALIRLSLAFGCDFREICCALFLKISRLVCNYAFETIVILRLGVF